MNYHSDIGRFANDVKSAFDQVNGHTKAIVQVLEALSDRIDKQDKKIKELEDTIIDMTLTGAHETDSKNICNDGE